MIYLTSVLACGLLQIWILWGFLEYKQVNFCISDLIKDGGLFIFASSLAITTLITHSKIFKRVQRNETYWSIFFMIFIMFFCIMGFSTSIQINDSKTAFFIEQNSLQNATQIACSFLAIMYGFFIEKRVTRAVR